MLWYGCFEGAHNNIWTSNLTGKTYNGVRFLKERIQIGEPAKHIAFKSFSARLYGFPAVFGVGFVQMHIYKQTSRQ